MVTKLFTTTLEYLVTPLLVLSSLVLFGVYTVSQPAVFTFLYEEVSVNEGKARADGIMIAEAIRGADNFDRINQQLQAGTMGPREIYHFDDVRNKLRDSGLLLLGFFSLTIMIVTVTRINWSRVVLSSIAWYLLFTVVSIIWAAISFRSFFRTLHWWVFQDNTWILPNGCYSLRLYPYLVWQVLGAVVLGGTLLILISLLIYNTISRRKLKSRSGEELDAH